jgi:hypothetical protein
MGTGFGDRFESPQDVPGPFEEDVDGLDEEDVDGLDEAA